MPVLTDKQFKVLRFDTRGHGRSSAPSGDYTLEQLADDVKGLSTRSGSARLPLGRPLDGRDDRPGFCCSSILACSRASSLADTTSRRPPNAAEPEVGGAHPHCAGEGDGCAGRKLTLERWFTAPYRFGLPQRTSSGAHRKRHQELRPLPASSAAAMPYRGSISSTA